MRSRTGISTAIADNGLMMVGEIVYPKRSLMTRREGDLKGIGESLGDSVMAASSRFVVAEGDSLALLKRIPSHTVSLVLTDPPYHSTKKRNVYGDTQFLKDSQYLEWMAEYAKEWHRVLRPNGSMFCFCAPQMAAQLEVLFMRDYNILAHIVWTKPNEPGFDGWKQKMKKEALREWYSYSERIIFAEPAYDGNLFRSGFANLLKEMRKRSGLSMKELTEKIGAYGRVNHGGAVSNWEAGRNTPSREQYTKISEALCSTGRIESMPPYEDVVRPFAVDGSKEFTDVWHFHNVRPYEGKHPAEKPLDLLQHAISATTYPGDIVLDCFAGSGSTAVAAVGLGRLAVSMEIDHKLATRTADELKALGITTALANLRVDTEQTPLNKMRRASQLSMLSGSE